jgi:hypothetical protein
MRFRREFKAWTGYSSFQQMRMMSMPDTFLLAVRGRVSGYPGQGAL